MTAPLGQLEAIWLKRVRRAPMAAVDRASARRANLLLSGTRADFVQNRLASLDVPP